VIADATGMPIHREAFVEHAPLYEDLRLSAVLSGALANDGSIVPATLEPAGREDGNARVTSFVLNLGTVTKRYGLAPVADQVLAALVKQGLVKDETDSSVPFTWWLEAHEHESGGPSHRRITLRREPYPLTTTPLAALGVEDEPRDPLPIFVKRDVLDELRDQAARNLSIERADLLVGKVARVKDGIAVVITDRLAATNEAGASRTHFTFSPLTFVAARRQVQERGDGTVLLGWSHNHPPACGGTCRGYVPACSASTLFFSADDRAVHRAAFLTPYMVALVSGKAAHRSPETPEVLAYGWRDGAIVERELAAF
jgi:hypothetical protein